MQALMLFMVLATPGEAPAAQVLEVGKGAMVTIGKGKPRPLELGESLPEDATVIAGKEPVDLLILGNGATDRIKAGARVTLKAVGCLPRADVTSPDEKVNEAQLKVLRVLVGARAGAGITRRDIPETKGASVWPLHTSSITSTRPTFRWAERKGAVEYEVRLSSGESADRKLEWTVTTTKPVLPFPREKASLKAGRALEWEVVARFKGKDDPVEVVSPCEFTVLEASAMKQTEAIARIARGKHPAAWMKAALLYDAMGAYGEALQMYTRVNEKRPGQKEVLKSLIFLHGLARDREKQKEARALLRKLEPADD